MYSCGPLWSDVQREDDQLEHTYSSSAPIRNVRTCWKQWTIGSGGKRGSGISVLMALHDDDDDEIHLCLSRGNTIVCRFFQGLWFYTKKKNGANTSSIWSPQRKCYSYKDALWKHESQGLLTGWKHRLLWHCCWSFARKYMSIISVYILPRIRTLNVNRYN